MEATNRSIGPIKRQEVFAMVLRIDAGSMGANFQSPQDSEHTVQKGDTFQSIAQKYGVALDLLQQNNPQVDRNNLTEGFVIKIPASKMIPLSGNLPSQQDDVMEVSQQSNIFEQLTTPSSNKLVLSPKIWDLVIQDTGSPGELGPLEVAPLPEWAEQLHGLLELLPPGMEPQEFFDSLMQHFPGLDTNQDNTVDMEEMKTAMMNHEFPPQNFAGDAGKKLLKFFTDLDPQLQGLKDALKQCSTQQDYIAVNKAITARVTELMQGFYGETATVQDASTQDFWGCDDILFNGVPISLTHQVDGWNNMHNYLQNHENFWDPHVGSNVAQ
jgi:LysM repeat protein